MRFHSVKLINFKSIGDTDLSEIIIEPQITAVIGKNESGKSNVIEGLSYINLLRNMNALFIQDNINRTNVSYGGKIKYIIELKPTSEEISTYGDCADTEITIDSSGYSATGGIIEYYNKVIGSKMTELIELIKDNPFKLDRNSSNLLIQQVQPLKRTDPLNIPQMVSALFQITTKYDNASIEIRSSLDPIYSELIENWNRFIKLLPTVFYRNSNKTLQYQYGLENVKKELSSSQSLLGHLVDLIKIDRQDFIAALQVPAPPNILSIRKRIEKNLEKYLNKPFSLFYKTESVKLSIEFENAMVYFTLQSDDGESLALSERSNGLRWYLDTFIDTQANNIPNQNVLYLFDEPGTSLHVNAQKELLVLFKDLTDKGNQIVYSTHSPYMLNLEEDGIHRIRAVVKSQDGFTSIFKTAYDARIAPESQRDTLAPIVNALGMRLEYTIGPAKDKINIVTEGMSDYIFLCTMAKLLQIDTNKYSIIPCVGASNCISICCILQGWGCSYIALFDYDKEGVEKGGNHLRDKLGLDYLKQYCYVKDVSELEIKEKTYSKHPYMIEDLVLRSEIDRFYTEHNYSELDKTLTAKLMCNDIEAGTFVLSEESKTNFMDLFNRIISYFDCDN